MQIFSFISNFLARCSRNWFPLLVYLGFLLPVIAGFYGHAFGLPHLFRDDLQLRDYGLYAIVWNSPAVWGHAAATLLILSIWAGIFLQEEICRGHGAISFGDFVGYLVRNAWIFVALLPAAAAVPPTPGMKWQDISKEIGESLLGIVYALIIAGVVVFLIRQAYLVLLPPLRRTTIAEFLLSAPRRAAIAQRFASARWTILVVLFCVAIGLVTGLFTYWPVLAPSAALCTLLIWIIAIYFLFSVTPTGVRVAIVFGVVAVFFLAADNPFHNRFPGFGIAYDEENRLRVPDPIGSQSSGGIEPRWALNAWHEYLTDATNKAICEEDYEPEPPSLDGPKPKMVVITVQGGAYWAGFWAAKVIDRLIELSAPGKALEGLTSHIRLLTGASGGMVASAYLSALVDPCTRDEPVKPPALEQQIRADIEASRDKASRNPGKFKTRRPVDRDGLAPVAQQILQRDIPRYMLSPFAYVVGLRDSAFAWDKWDDRGSVLEWQWHTLATPFSKLELGERNGWRPSLIFSPMVIEAGQPLLISNLDLSAMVKDRVTTTKKEAIEFFRWFPDMREHLKIQTALRMNASFPYVSPAVSLPTDPPQRVVDAGYYDNYGVDLAVSWLSQPLPQSPSQPEPNVIEWLKKYTSGVILIQIRAFPTSKEDGAKQSSFWRRLGLASQWLTSPIEAVVAARSAVFRNDQRIEGLKGRFDPGFVETFVFENRASGKEIEMSWYVRCKALEIMNRQLKRHEEVLKKLSAVWVPFTSIWAEYPEVTDTKIASPCPPSGDSEEAEPN